MRINSKIIIGLIIISGSCMLLKMLKIPFVNQVFMIDMLILAFFLLGHGFIGKKLPGGIKYQILQRFSGIGMFMATTDVLFRFLYWRNWEQMIKIGLIPFACTFLLFAKWDVIKRKFPEQFNYFRFSFALPIYFLAFSTFICLVIPDKIFFQVFSEASKTMNYEEFQRMRVNHYLELEHRK